MNKQELKKARSKAQDWSDSQSDPYSENVETINKIEINLTPG